MDDYEMIGEVADVLASFVDDVRATNPKFADALDSAAYWLSLSEVKDAVVRVAL